MDSSEAVGGVTSYKASQLLLEACVLRVVDFVERSQKPAVPLVSVVVNPTAATAKPANTPMNTNIKEAFEEWLGEWYYFASHLYYFIENGLIDFQEFVYALSKAKLNNSTSSPIKDNMIIWLLAQCLPLESVKNIFKKDALLHYPSAPSGPGLAADTDGHGAEQSATNAHHHHHHHQTSLMATIQSFINVQQLQEQEFPLRDTSFGCFMSRVKMVLEVPPLSKVVIS